MADDEHALARIVARDGIDHAAQAQNDVAPAFAAGRAKIKLADVLALLVQVGIALRDAVDGEAVKDAEFFLAQALVDLARHFARCLAANRRRVVHGGAIDGVQHDARRLGRAQIRRMQHHVGPRALRHGGEPVGQRLRLLHAEIGQGHVNVALGNADHQPFGRFRGVACNVAGALAVPHQPDFLRPLLLHRASAIHV